MFNKNIFVQNVFNHIDYDEKSDSMEFAVKESESVYGMVHFTIGSITDISGCEDADNPEEYLNINI